MDDEQLQIQIKIKALDLIIFVIVGDNLCNLNDLLITPLQGLNSGSAFAQRV